MSHLDFLAKEVGNRGGVIALYRESPPDSRNLMEWGMEISRRAFGEGDYFVGQLLFAHLGCRLCPGFFFEGEGGAYRVEN